MIASPFKNSDWEEWVHTKTLKIIGAIILCCVWARKKQSKTVAISWMPRSSKGSSHSTAIRLQMRYTPWDIAGLSKGGEVSKDQIIFPKPNNWEQSSKGEGQGPEQWGGTPWQGRQDRARGRAVWGKPEQHGSDVNLQQLVSSSFLRPHSHGSMVVGNLTLVTITRKRKWVWGSGLWTRTLEECF